MRMPDTRAVVAGAWLSIGAQLAPSAALAATSSRLLYSRAAEAEPCPDEPTLRAEVARLLGYDPFVAFAKTTVVVAIEHDQTKLRARIYLDDGGVSRGAREFVADHGNCGELISAVALAVSIALDPMQAARAESSETTLAPHAETRTDAPSDASASPPLETTEAVPAPPRAADGPAEARAPTPRRRFEGLTVDVGGGGFVSLGSLPEPSGGPFAFARVRSGRFSIGADVRAELPVGSAVPAVAGQARAWAWGVAFAPCVHAGPVAFCATGSVAEIHAEGQGVASPRTAVTGVGTVGARVAALWPIAGSLLLNAQADFAPLPAPGSFWTARRHGRPPRSRVASGSGSFLRFGDDP